MKTSRLPVLVLLALSGGCSSANDPSLVEATCHENLSANECAALAEIKLPDALPAARGNAYAEDLNATVFGFHVFFDARFSRNQTVRCESCHSVDFAFADNQPVPINGLAPGERNSPTIFNAARYTTVLWDGRADTLWSQPLLAFENPTEMDFTRLEIVHLLKTLYDREYSKAFGALPDVSDSTRFPARGAPGEPAFDAMAEADKESVNRVVSNVGKALEAYMRKLATGPSAVDRYLGGATDALGEREIQGMYVFASSGCLNCHSGPALSDNAFHNLGVPAREGQAPDEGRAAGIPLLEANEFNQMGPFFDGELGHGLGDLTPVLGGFRTPSLRNLPRSAPYGHNGVFPTLRAVVDFHLEAVPGEGSVGNVDPLLKKRNLSEDDRDALVKFLEALVGEYPALPWGQWPNGNG
jgi:cytochrome c peroxidase